MENENVVLVPKDDTNCAFGTSLISNRELYIELPRKVLMPIRYLDLSKFYIMKNGEEISEKDLF